VQMDRYDRCFQDRLEHRMQRACSLRGLDRPLAALAYQWPGVTDSAFGLEEVLAFGSGQACVHTDNIATVVYINRQGGVGSFRMLQLARHLLLWSQHRLKSLHATHIPGKINHVAESLSQQAPPSDGPADLESIRPGTGRSVCLTGIHSLPVMIQFFWWPHFGPTEPGSWSSCSYHRFEGPPFSGEGHNLAPAQRTLESPSMVPGHNQEYFRDLPPAVVNTLVQARAPSTRQL
ncbi:hypothetical protein M9458_011983, partial [Cirrhinus mrigala]